MALITLFKKKVFWATLQLTQCLYTHPLFNLTNCVSKSLVIRATDDYYNIVNTTWFWKTLQFSWGDGQFMDIVLYGLIQHNVQKCPLWDCIGRLLISDLWDKGRLFRGNDSQVETLRPSKYCTIWLLSFCVIVRVAFKICVRLHPKTQGLELHSKVIFSLARWREMVNGMNIDLYHKTRPSCALAIMSYLYLSA